MYVYKQLPTKVVELTNADFKEEAYLEGFLIEHKELLAFSDDEDPKVKILGRQFTFKNSKDRIDLLAIEFDTEKKIAYLRVVELKKNKADEKALKQLEKYIDQIRKIGWLNMLNEWELDINIKSQLDEWGVEKDNVQLMGVLVAPEISTDVQQRLANDSIQGIEVKRLQTKNQDESFIFVYYHPEVQKMSKTEIKPEEFWKTRNIDEEVKNKIDQLLNTLINDHLYVKYWKSGSIRVYVDNNDDNSIIAALTTIKKGFHIQLRKYKNGKRSYDDETLSESEKRENNDIVKEINKVAEDFKTGT